MRGRCGWRARRRVLITVPACLEILLLSAGWQDRVSECSARGLRGVCPCPLGQVCATHTRAVSLLACVSSASPQVQHLQFVILDEIHCMNERSGGDVSRVQYPAAPRRRPALPQQTDSRTHFA